MADNQTIVIKKMIDNTSGQGDLSCDYVTIANHIDYSKWNNHQRLGWPNLIKKTHKFFENSLIYYNDRPDLMVGQGNTLRNKTKQLVCWEAQQGGLEGLRQKGWSVVNLLVIQRQSNRNITNTKTLAQGDNQVVCPQYQLVIGLKAKESWKEMVGSFHSIGS